MENQLKAAIKEIKRLKKQSDKYLEEIKILKMQIQQLEESKLVAPRKTNSINHILREADEAMQRNIEKLRREMECRAKTKREVTGLKD